MLGSQSQCWKDKLIFNLICESPKISIDFYGSRHRSFFQGAWLNIALQFNFFLFTAKQSTQHKISNESDIHFSMWQMPKLLLWYMQQFFVCKL